MRETFPSRESPNSKGQHQKTKGFQAGIFLRALFTPIKLLFFYPAVFLTSLAVAYAFGLTFLLLTTFSNVFQSQYGFSLGISSLCYLGMGIGMLIAVTIFSLTSDKLREWHRHRDFHEPENRLALMAVFCPVLPVGYFWYGWSADKAVHWMVPIVGTSFIGLGTMFTLVGD